MPLDVGLYRVRATSRAPGLPLNGQGLPLPEGRYEDGSAALYTMHAVPLDMDLPMVRATSRASGPPLNGQSLPLPEGRHGGGKSCTLHYTAGTRGEPPWGSYRVGQNHERNMKNYGPELGHSPTASFASLGVLRPPRPVHHGMSHSCRWSDRAH